MRSNLVFGALRQISNRYRLCKLATKATRKVHRPNTRLQDTINDVLVRFREANPEAQKAKATPRTDSPEWCGSLTSPNPVDLQNALSSAELHNGLGLEKLTSFAVEVKPYPPGVIDHPQS
jgi:hypothetical protein